ncbi:hypothetical protein JTE90_000157 [Oedothorax gibbosus]|uniref:Uncharacterized protein n=1 Tax=Oedothorax gibbosus TaxID=931172 RepID=A0AAV6TK45_9ARAC|nr:hypothetical protein JTE90_000157 [Oedothorax gibbosus]
MRKVSESVNPDIYSPSSSQNGDSFPRTFPPSVTGHHRQFDGLTAGRNYEYQSSPPLRFYGRVLAVSGLLGELLV